LAVTLAELAYLFTDSTAQVALPRQVGSSTADAARNTARVAGANFVLAVAVVACIAVTSPMLVPLVFGRPFSGSVAPLLALGPGVVALAVIRPLGAFLIRLDRPFVYSGASILGLVVNVALNLAFIPRWGIVGSAVASSIPYVMLATFHVGWFKRSSKVEVRHFLPHVS
jgi:O-antigen/teichoic acid export membrane protein